MSTPEELVDRLRRDPARWQALIDDPLRVVDEEGIPIDQAGRLVALVREADDLELPEDRRRAMAALFRLLAAADRQEASVRRERTLEGIDPLADPLPVTRKP